MKYAQLLKVLKENQTKELVFEFDQGQIRRDYHITEVLNTLVQAIDCGGQVDNWKETVLQLVEPGHQDGERFMEGQKALKILEQSAKLITLDESAELILEYKPQNSSAAQRYIVSNIEMMQEKILVQTEGHQTQCKAAKRSASLEAQSSSCCGPLSEKKISSCG